MSKDNNKNEAIIDNEENDIEILDSEEETSTENSEINMVEEVDKWKDAYIRQVADFENFRKRKDKEKEEYVKFASEKIIVKILEVVDNFERGISSSKNNSDFEGLLKGVELIFGQLQKLLSEEGVEEIESVNKEFNPYEHQAVMVENSEEFDNNIITQELQKGYKLKGKVIRPTMVKVCKK
ncbi:MAG: nucleotide exchange factor GrpE [Fusobacteria bacterium]|nr:nucleotide exchange factor GrpE [Fusobacteriota bacterium]